MPRHGNQTLINIMQIKSEPIASDSPWLMIKSIEDQGCKHNDKKFGLFVRKLSFSRSKNGFFIFCSSGVINVRICCVESIPPWAINQKILPGPNRVKVFSHFECVWSRLQKRPPFKILQSTHRLQLRKLRYLKFTCTNGWNNCQHHYQA